MDKPLIFADYLLIAVFFATMVGVGIYYGRRARSTAQFLGSDKTVPWWLAGISFWMNSFSALAFVMYSALAYKFGFVTITLSWIAVPIYLFAGRYLAVRWRRAATTNPIEYTSERYTPVLCKAMAWLGLPMQFLDNALKLLAIGSVVGVGMGFPIGWSIAVSGAIIIVYTFLGGLKATLVCDFIQFFIIIALVLILPPLCLGRLGGADGLVAGAKNLIDGLPKGFFDLTAGQYTWAYVIVFFLICACSSSTNWSMVQRYYSTRSEKDARKVAYLMMVLDFVTPPLMYFPAMAARVILPDIPEEGMNGVYASICKAVLPVGFIGLVVAAMFSATMSSLAGNFNAVASVVVNELCFRKSKDVPESRRLWAARIATALIGASVIVLAFVMRCVQGADDLFNISNKIFGVFMPAISIPMLAGLFVRRFSRRSGLFALLVGIVFGLSLFALGQVWPYLREMVPMFLSTSAATIAALFVGTRLFPDDRAASDAVDRFFARLAE